MKYALLTVCLFYAGYRGICADEQVSPGKSPTSAQAPAAEKGFSGKVVETMNAGDYTYILIDTGSGKNWAAAPKFPVKVGDSAGVAAAMAMPDYHSKILNRDFDVVYFTDHVMVNGVTGGMTSQMPALPKDHPPIGAAGSRAPIDLSGIKKAEGGLTVAEVYADKAQLKGKQVKVRGKVVKYNSMIMGRNWLHLRDGTGAEGSNDLLVTSTTSAKVGDTVLAAGVIAVDKDFGANYKYAVMMEEAKITVE